eukprot:765333-Hanusia_phi.AAC.3
MPQHSASLSALTSNCQEEINWGSGPSTRDKEFARELGGVGEEEGEEEDESRRGVQEGCRGRGREEGGCRKPKRLLLQPSVLSTFNNPPPAAALAAPAPPPAPAAPAAPAPPAPAAAPFTVTAAWRISRRTSMGADHPTLKGS